MQIKIFNIPIGSDDSMTEEMNHFLRANKIIDIKKELALLDGNSCWTFCVTYIMPNKSGDTDNGKHYGEKTDYKAVLEPEVFERFSALRKCRKAIADEEAIPAYAVFTDAELAELARLPELTLSDMQKVSGIGKKKVEKYGHRFIVANSSQVNETGGIFDGTDSHS